MLTIDLQISLSTRLSQDDSDFQTSSSIISLGFPSNVHCTMTLASMGWTPSNNPRRVWTHSTRTWWFWTSSTRIWTSYLSALSHLSSSSWTTTAVSGIKYCTWKRSNGGHWWKLSTLTPSIISGDSSKVCWGISPKALLPTGNSSQVLFWLSSTTSLLDFMFFFLLSSFFSWQWWLFSPLV